MHGSPGFELGYAGVRAGCMQCHSNEGFEYHVIGYDPESNLDFASKITCGTCHGNHVSLKAGLSAPMRTDDAILALADGVTVFDFESSSNTCANCHQARSNGTAYSSVDTVWNDDGTVDFVVHEDSVWVSSPYAGPHYTTMTNNIFGVGGYTDSPGTVMGIHKKVGCVGCHMGESEGTNFSGCTYNFLIPEEVPPTDPEDPDTPKISFSQDIIPIFTKNNNCTSCHGNGGQTPDLTADNAYNSLNSAKYINKDNPEDSKIYKWSHPDTDTHKQKKYTASELIKTKANIFEIINEKGLLLISERIKIIKQSFIKIIIFSS